jgi:hypothetical protein
MHDQPAQQPRGGPAAAGTAAAQAASSQSGSGTGQPGTGQSGTGPSAAQAEARRGYVPRPTPGYDDVSTRDDGPSGAALGLTILAAVFMMIAGVLGFFEGLAAIVRGTFFVTLPNYTFSLSAVGWGWVHLIIGVLVFAAGAALLADQTWARITGVVLAAFQIIASFVFLPYYPVWAVVLIALSSFVIWALLTPRNRR